MPVILRSYFVKNCFQNFSPRCNVLQRNKNKVSGILRIARMRYDNYSKINPGIADKFLMLFFQSKFVLLHSYLKVVQSTPVITHPDITNFGSSELFWCSLQNDTAVCLLQFIFVITNSIYIPNRFCQSCGSYNHGQL